MLRRAASIRRARPVTKPSTLAPGASATHAPTPPLPSLRRGLGPRSRRHRRSAGRATPAVSRSGQGSRDGCGGLPERSAQPRSWLRGASGRLEHLPEPRPVARGRRPPRPGRRCPGRGGRSSASPSSTCVQPPEAGPGLRAAAGASTSASTWWRPSPRALAPCTPARTKAATSSKGGVRGANGVPVPSASLIRSTRNVRQPSRSRSKPTTYQRGPSGQPQRLDTSRGRVAGRGGVREPHPLVVAAAEGQDGQHPVVDTLGGFVAPAGGGGHRLHGVEAAAQRPGHDLDDLAERPDRRLVARPLASWACTATASAIASSSRRRAGAGPRRARGRSRRRRRAPRPRGSRGRAAVRRPAQRAGRDPQLVREQRPRPPAAGLQEREQPQGAGARVRHVVDLRAHRGQNWPRSSLAWSRPDRPCTEETSMSDSSTAAPTPSTSARRSWPSMPSTAACSSSPCRG